MSSPLGYDTDDFTVRSYANLGEKPMVVGVTLTFHPLDKNSAAATASRRKFSKCGRRSIENEDTAPSSSEPASFR